MNPNARRIDQILADTPLTATLLARLTAARQAARAISPVCTEIAPDFDARRPGSCDLRGGVLRIWLRSSVQSTKLRQAIPRLLTALRSNGLEVNEIRIGVQPGRVRENGPGQARNTTPDALSAHPKGLTAYGHAEKMLSFSRKLALTLPDSELRRAIARFGAVVDAKVARMRDSDQTFYEQNREKSHPSAQAGEKDPACQHQIAHLPANPVQADANYDGASEGEK